MGDASFEEVISGIVSSVLLKRNVILHAPGGTGKSYMLKKIAKTLGRKGKKVYCTATTGVAAINLNDPDENITASTLHSFAGIGTATETAEKLYSKVYHDDRPRKRWMNADVLIIDEVSMLGAQLLGKIDYVARKIRREEATPFGGVTLIVSGDFLQLPPVKDNWIFDAQVWEESDFVPFLLDKPKRYDDGDYFKLLLRIREGIHTNADIEVLQSRVVAYDEWKKGEQLREELRRSGEADVEDEIKPTVLYSKKIDVEEHNLNELRKLPGEEIMYTARDTFVPLSKRARKEFYGPLLNDTIPDTIILKRGAQVMLKYNLDIAAGLVNGSRAVVVDLTHISATVKFLNGNVHKIDPIVWKIEDNDAKISRFQIPFILAWGLTFHKSQGSTLDFAICDLGPSVFSPGQAYVALSRVKNLKGLFLSELYPKSIKVDGKAVAYSRYLREKAIEEQAAILAEMDEKRSGDVLAEEVTKQQNIEEEQSDEVPIEEVEETRIVYDIIFPE